MNNRNFAAIAYTSDGRQVLRYIEPEGNDVRVHNVLVIDGASVDLTLSGFEKLSDEQIENLYTVMIDEFNTDQADRLQAQVTQTVLGKNHD